MQYRLPGFAMGIITRESVRDALLKGITAEQIISFVQQNVHPQVFRHSPLPVAVAITLFQAKKKPVAVPETVVDQIRLWESERNRVAYQKGILYDSFPTNNDMFEVSEQRKILNNVLINASGGRTVC